MSTNEYLSYCYSYSTALVDIHVHSLTHVDNNDVHEWAPTKDRIQYTGTYDVIVNDMHEWAPTKDRI